MKVFATFGLLLLIFNPLKAGDLGRLTQLEHIYQPAVLIGGTNSVGFAHIGLSPVSEIGRANPAALFAFDAVRAGISFKQATTLRDLPIKDMKTQTRYGLLPTAAAIAVPWKKFRFGLAYQHSYATRIDFGELQITTIQNQDGTGETTRPISESNIYTIAALAAYRLTPGLFKNDKLTLGISLRENFFKKHDTILRTDGKFSAFNTNWTIASLYKTGIYSLGVVYEKGLSFSGNFKISGLQTVTQNGGSLATPISLKQPDIVRGGFSIQATNSLTLSATYSFYFWQNIAGSDYKNRKSFSGGLIFRPKNVPDWISGVSLSFYRSIRGYKSSRATTEKELAFVDAGLQLNIRNFDLLLQLRDSHLFDDHTFQQTSIGISLEYPLPFCI